MQPASIPIPRLPPLGGDRAEGAREGETNSPARLSKTRFLSGLQCLKRLWLELHEPSTASTYDPLTQFRLEQGKRVGELAQKLWPRGVLVEQGHTEHDDAERVTARLLADPTVPAIYEAAFTHDGIRIRVDVLARNPAGGGGGFDLCEVKSSTGVRDVHLWDVAVQLHVLEGAGVPVRRVRLVHLNNGYVYPGGEYDLGQIFTVRDVTELARERLVDVRCALPWMEPLVESPEPPPIEVGPHCSRPYDCPFFEKCAVDRPEHPLDELPRLGPNLRAELVAMGVRDLREIPADHERLSPLQRRVTESVRSGRPWIGTEIAAILAALPPPIHFLDFETAQLPLPRYAGTRPWETLSVQWSNHVLHPDGRLEHRQFLHADLTDPRRAFAGSLLAGTAGAAPVVVYSDYEARCIASLELVLPDLAPELARLRERIFDILQPIREHVYHPEFHGSFSLKSVLPALVPELGYDGLAIADGGAASVAWLEMVAPETQAERAASLRQALLAYCGRDTEALVALYRDLVSRRIDDAVHAASERHLQPRCTDLT